jgi:hypothetical protein
MCDKPGELVYYDQFNNLIRALNSLIMATSLALVVHLPYRPYRPYRPLQNARYYSLSEVQSRGKQMLEPGGGFSICLAKEIWEREWAGCHRFERDCLFTALGRRHSKHYFSIMADSGPLADVSCRGHTGPLDVRPGSLLNSRIALQP